MNVCPGRYLRWADTETEYARGDAPCSTLDSSIMPQYLVDAFAADFFCSNALGYRDDRRSDNVMPEIALEWDATVDILLYTKVAESAKSGGFASATILVITDQGEPLAEYDDEKARDET